MNLIEIRLSECVERFMDYCSKKSSWKTFNTENLVQTETGFHRFVLVESPQLGNLKDAVKHSRVFIRDEEGYRSVTAKFTAFVSFEPISAGLLLLFEEDPSLSSWLSLYDLGSAVKNSSTFSKINLTNSEVFLEFEKFLREVYRINLSTFRFTADLEICPPTNDFSSKPASTLAPKKSFFKRLLDRHFISIFENSLSKGFTGEIDQGEFLEYRKADFWFESSCCICIATISARARQLLT